MRVGELLIEGKTKMVYELADYPGLVLIQSKDRITAGDGARAHDLFGKATVSNSTNSLIFDHLNKVGVKTHYIKRGGNKSFVARHCDMIPIEWVTRRLATGSFLKRNPGVKEGFRFNPPKLETFFKDDANHDPQWSTEQLLSAELKVGGRIVDKSDVERMSRLTVCIFEILEKAWQTLDCVLVDMKIEFGVDVETKEIILADVIDSDSWRLWPEGDKKKMKDKQVYRDMDKVTDEALSKVKDNFLWVADKLKTLKTEPSAQVVVLMGSAADKKHGEAVMQSCESLVIPCELRVTSAHKSTSETLKILAEYEGSKIPTVFVAVAGRSNGLGPVLSGNTSYPVINCPPVTPDWGAQDIWSSLRLPSGLGCSTVLSPDGAAQCAANMMALHDHVIWSKLRVQQVDNRTKLNSDDGALRANAN